MTACPPHDCHHPIWLGGQWLHTCRERFLQPIAARRSLRLVRSAS